jgi:hypothetical protein
MSSEYLAGRLFYALVCVVAELLEYAEYPRLIDCRRAIAKHMNNPAADVWIGVVGHL